MTLSEVYTSSFANSFYRCRIKIFVSNVYTLGCLVTPEMYGHLTHWLSSLANGRVILSLEGGYNINSISHAMTICTKVLLGDPLPMLESGQSPCTSAVHTINNVLKTQKQYWPNLLFNVSLPKENVLPKAKVPHMKTSEQVKNVEELSKSSESKIALEEIESEKLELKLSIDKSFLNSVTDEEILKLQNEVENIKIKNSSCHDTAKPAGKAYKKLMKMQDTESAASNNKGMLCEICARVRKRRRRVLLIDFSVVEYTKQCVNEDGKEGFSDKNFNSSNSSSSGEQNEGAVAQTNVSMNLYDYLSQNLRVSVTVARISFHI